MAFEPVQARVCDVLANCDHDHGTLSNAVEQPGDYSDDLSHLSIQGYARFARLAWKALQDVRLVPRR